MLSEGTGQSMLCRLSVSVVSWAESSAMPVTSLPYDSLPAVCSSSSESLRVLTKAGKILDFLEMGQVQDMTVAASLAPSHRRANR